MATRYDQADIPMQPLRVISASVCDPGMELPDTEDFCAFYEPEDVETLVASGCLYVIADSGGARMRGGEKTSRFAAERVLGGYFTLETGTVGDRLRTVVREVNNLMVAETERTGVPATATLVAAAVHQGRLTVASVGDCRAYLIHDGQAQQITHDHTRLGDSLRTGAASVEEVQSYAVRNALTRCLGRQRGVEVDIFEDAPLYPGDFIVLCSNGLTRYIDGDELARLSATGTTEEVCRKLVNFANDAGGEDSIAVLAAELVSADVADDGGGAYLPMYEGENWQAVESPGQGAAAARVRDAVKAVRDLMQDKTKTVLLGALIVGLLALVFLGIYAVRLLNEQGGTTGQEPAFPAASTPAPTVTLPGVPAFMEPSVTVPVEEQVPGTVTEETPTEAPPPSSGPSACVLAVQSGNTLFSMVRQFDLPYEADTQYYYYEDCDTDQRTCPGARQPIDNHASIFVGWFVDIPVTDQAACEGGGGLWVRVEE